MTPRRLLILLLSLFLSLRLSAQGDEDLLARILEVNMPPTLEASWHREFHSSLLQENLISEGKVYIQEPDRLRWETLSPVSRLSVYNGTGPRGRFRLPVAKDFQATVLESDQLSVTLVPVRRDLKQLFSKIVLTLYPSTLLVSSALILGRDGDWTRLSFSGISHPDSFPDHLFETQ